MNIQDCFSSSYAQARSRFLEAAREGGADIESYPHPPLKGPSGEELAVDVATQGPVDAGQVLMIVSGTHGVEGHAGSGCQVGLLGSGFCSEAAAATRVVLVHAINPYGFAYSRRTNEDNIDMNRNFVEFERPLPVNAAYESHASEFLPSGNTLQEYQRSCEYLERAAETRGGYLFIKRALQPGQYLFPDGLYYGGARPAWSNTLFKQICNRAFHGAGRVAVLDLHTGLGPYGVGEVIFMTPDPGRDYASRFAAPVSIAGAGASVTSSVKGPLVIAAHSLIRGEQALCCVLEFGTVPLRENVQAKIFENWSHHSLPPGDPMREQAKKRMRDAYYCDTHEWKRSVFERFDEVVRRMHDWLNGT